MTAADVRQVALIEAYLRGYRVWAKAVAQRAKNTAYTRAWRARRRRRAA